MEIVPDPIHSALLALPFLVAITAMYFILWKPLLAYLEERAEVSQRARHEAHELESAAAEQLAKIESRLAAARAHVAVVRQDARNRALAREAEIVGAARGKAEKRVEQALSELGADKRAAAEALRTTANELSTQIAAQVLGRPVA